MISSNHSRHSKVMELSDLATVIETDHKNGKRIIHCHGVFDLLHIGHIRHFNQAKEMGDILVVTITTDVHVNKGPNRPAFSEELRAEAIAAMNCVDYVAINRSPTAVEAINLLKPSYYVKGSDYKNAEDDMSGGIILEENAVKSVGGQIVFTDDITFSSSQLINQHMPAFPKEVSEYLTDISSRRSSDEILKYLENARSMKVLVIGETIIDQYVYCQTMGKSGKEPILAARQTGKENFVGGIVAVANHVAAFCDDVSMLTFLGGADSQEDFIRDNLAANITPEFLYMDGDSPTIVKRRFIESYPFQKLFELYLMDNDENRPEEESRFEAKLNELLPHYDAVLVVDYGHGMLGPQAVQLLCKKSKFLAINTQLNAGNMGFNTVSKYPTADFICVSETEIRLEARSRRKDLKEIVLDVSYRLSCDHILVTQGTQGCLCYSKNDGFLQVPAVATRVVDRIGAGDAVFSVASLCASQGAPSEITGFIGSVAGAEAVATIANRDPIQRVPFFRNIETMLK